MTITRAKEILGIKAMNWSDERLQRHLDSLSVIAKIAAESAIEYFVLKKDPDLEHK